MLRNFEAEFKSELYLSLSHESKSEFEEDFVERGNFYFYRSLKECDSDCSNSKQDSPPA